MKQLTTQKLLELKYKLALKHIYEHNSEFANIADKPSNLNTRAANLYEKVVVNSVLHSEQPSIWRILINFVSFIAVNYGDGNQIKFRKWDFLKHTRTVAYVLNMLVDILKLYT